MPSVETCTRNTELQTLWIILASAYVLCCLSVAGSQLQKEEWSSRGVSSDKKCVAIKHQSLVFNDIQLLDWRLQCIYQFLNTSIIIGEIRCLIVQPQVEVSVARHWQEFGQENSIVKDWVLIVFLTALWKMSYVQRNNTTIEGGSWIDM